MRDGRILQVDTPQTLYEQPRDLFVAGFIGSPAMNLVEATIDGGERRVRPVPYSARPGRAVRRRLGARRLGIRPESVRGRRRSRPPSSRRSMSRSSCSRSWARTPMSSSASRRRASPPTRRRATRRTSARTRGDPGSLLNARVDPRTAAQVGGPLRLAVDPARFHFFDRGVRCVPSARGVGAGRRARQRQWRPDRWY